MASKGKFLSFNVPNFLIYFCFIRERLPVFNSITKGKTVESEASKKLEAKTGRNKQFPMRSSKDTVKQARDKGASSSTKNLERTVLNCKNTNYTSKNKKKKYALLKNNSDCFDDLLFFENESFSMCH